MEVSLRRAVGLLGCPFDSPPVAYLLSLAPKSRNTQAQALRLAANAFGVSPADVQWHTIEHAQMAALRSWIAERYAPSTCNRILAAVRSVLSCCVRNGSMTADAFARARVQPIRGKRAPKGRSLSADELAKLFQGARDVGGSLGARHAAMLALGYGCGLRRSEIVSIHVGAVDLVDRVVRVLGKGNVEALIPIPRGTIDAIAHWMKVRGSEPGPLLCAVRKGGELEHRTGLHASGLYELFKSLARRAKVETFSPHDLRRTYIGDLLDAGVDLATVQALARHADPVTTASYDRRGARVRAEAVSRLNVPF